MAYNIYYKRTESTEVDEEFVGIFDSKVEIQLTNNPMYIDKDGHKRMYPQWTPGASLFTTEEWQGNVETKLIIGSHQLTPLWLEGDVSYLFSQAKKLVFLSEEINTSRCTNMSYLFYKCRSMYRVHPGGLTSIDISSWDTSKVTSMAHMFDSCRKLHDANLFGINTDSLTDMSFMFYGCEELSSVDFTNVTTDHVTTMQDMFNLCPLGYIDISSFTIDSLTNTSNMFAYCWSLSEIIVNTATPDWNNGRITSSSGMFTECHNLPHWDGRKDITRANMSSTGYFAMLTDCIFYKLADGGICYLSNQRRDQQYHQYINRSNIPGGNKKFIIQLGSDDKFYIPSNAPAEMFSGITNETLNDMDKWVFADGQWNFTRLFFGCRNLVSIGPFTTNKNVQVTSLERAFCDCNKLKYVDLSAFDYSKLENILWTFMNCESLETLNLPICKLDGSYTSYLTNTIRAFENCRSLSDSEVYKILTNIKSNNIKYMNRMFFGCAGLINPKIPLLTTRTVEMIEMFRDCVNMKGIDISSFRVDGYIGEAGGSATSGSGGTSPISVSDIYLDTAGVTTFEGMFRNCHSLTYIDVSSLCPCKATNYSYMFYNCRKLETIEAGGADWLNLYPDQTKQWMQDRHMVTDPDTIQSDNMFGECVSLANYEPRYVTIKKANSNTRPTYNTTYGDPTEQGGYFKYHYKLYYRNDGGTCYLSNEKYEGAWWQEYTTGNPAFNRIVVLVSKVLVLPEDCSLLFRGCKDVNSDSSFFKRLDTSQVKNAYEMFRDSTITGFDSTYLNLRRVENIESMFKDCGNLPEVNLIGFRNAHRINRASNLFENCSRLREIDLRGIDTCDWRSLESFAENCTELTTVYLEGCNFRNVRNIDNCFRNCPKLRTVYVTKGSNWVTEGMLGNRSAWFMFEGDTKITHWNGNASASNANDGTKGYFTGVSPNRGVKAFFEPKRIYQKIDGEWKETWYMLIKENNYWDVMLFKENLPYFNEY